MPTFSILVPVYNHERYVGAALDSLLAQTDPDWEAVVVDDGSTDGSAGIVDEYARRDQRIRVIHKSNGGVATALNVGLDHARGDWIGWLSSDDLFDPHKLALHRAWFATRPAGRFFFTDFRTLDDASGRIGTEPFLMSVPESRWQLVEMLRGIFVNGITMCVHRSMFDQAGRFGEQLRYAQDYDMWLRFMSISEGIQIPDRTAVTRVHARQVFQVNSDVSLYDCGWASAAFLSDRRFESLFPRLDLGDRKTAGEAYVRAVEIAAAGQAYTYAMGAHPCLIRLIVDWVRHDRIGRGFAIDFGRRARGAAISLSRTPLGLVWRAAAVALEASEGSGGASLRSNVDPAEIGRGLWRWKRMRGESIDSTSNYLKRMGGDIPAEDEGTAPDGGANILIAEPSGDSGWKATAARLGRLGHRVLYVSPEAEPLNMESSVVTVRATDTWRTAMALTAAGPFDIAAGPAGTRMLRWPVAVSVLQGDPSVLDDDLRNAALRSRPWPRHRALFKSAAKWMARVVRRSRIFRG